MTKMVRVIATKKGYVQGLGRISPGDVFEMPEGVTGKWFEPVAKPATDIAPPPKGGGSAKAAAEPEPLKPALAKSK